MNAIPNLDEEYRSTRAALINAGVNMTDSIDALYSDWRRGRENSKSRVVSGDGVDVASLDRWWALHLAQFRSLIDPSRVAARAERVRKDRDMVRPRPHSA